MPLLKNFYLTLDIKMSTSSALWALFLQFNCLLYKQNTAFGLAAAGPRRKVRRSLEPESITFQSCKTSKTRRVCHGHVRQLIRTGQTIDQISIARPPTGRIPPRPRAGSATAPNQKCQFSFSGSCTYNLHHKLNPKKNSRLEGCSRTHCILSLRLCRKSQSATSMLAEKDIRQGRTHTDLYKYSSRCRTSYSRRIISCSHR